MTTTERARRVTVTPIAIALLLVGLFGAPKPVVAAAYTYACQNPLHLDYQHAILRGAGLGGVGTDYHAVIGDARVENLAACYIPQAPYYESLSAVLPANLQNPAIGSNGGIVQLGYMMCVAQPTIKCGNVPADGNLHFVYICDAVSGGVPCLADGWFGAAPIVGRRYRFRLEHTGSSWKYTLTDYTSGHSASTTIPDGGWSLGNGAWWGGEAWDPGSQVGPKNTDPGVDMYWMQYLRNATGSSWQVAHPIVRATCEIDTAINPNVCTGSWPSYFAGSVYNQNYSDGDAFRFWSNAH